MSVGGCRIVLAAALALGVAGGAGCINRNITRTETGRYIDAKAFAGVTPGKTSGAWVQAMLGAPTDVKKTDVGTEIWTWSYDLQKAIDGQFLIVTSHSTTTQKRRAMVEVKDGLVINKWFDERDLQNQESFN